MNESEDTSQAPTAVKYPHLKLTDWPFRGIPDEVSHRFMADREKVRTEIQRLLPAMARHSATTAFFLTAWFGCGKTHVLHYIEHLCKTEFNEKLVPVYTEFPANVVGFKSLYSEFIRRIDLNFVREIYLRVYQSTFKQEATTVISSIMPDMLNALALLLMGDRERQRQVGQWLIGSLTDKRTLKTLGLSRAIDTSEECVRTLSCLMRLAQFHAALLGEPFRIFWLVDDFHRVSKQSPRVRDDVFESFASLINSSPNGLSMLFAFSDIEMDIPKALADRVGIQRTLALPPFTRDEACIFIKEILKNYRPAGEGESGYFPFNEEAVWAIVDGISEKGGTLRPRTILQVCSAVLEEFDSLLAEKKVGEIDRNAVMNVLEHLELLSKGAGEDEI